LAVPVSSHDELVCNCDVTVSGSDAEDEVKLISTGAVVSSDEELIPCNSETVPCVEELTASDEVADEPVSCDDELEAIS
jgi:hypothetical protein